MRAELQQSRAASTRHDKCVQSPQTCLLLRAGYAPRSVVADRSEFGNDSNSRTVATVAAHSVVCYDSGGITGRSCANKSHETHSCLADTSVGPTIPPRILKLERSVITVQVTVLLVVVEAWRWD
ncbi:unnamed protein product [Hydatigera taeniaeformis]|uniref:Uncharacterized protein n=1 Tax=Hydatigena taeniaeformis TaxID=6205 RepID=A0A0R3WKK2_HYDTA|nr:unnamed protein product [Hydatigera taeniaeformis]